MDAYQAILANADGTANNATSPSAADYTKLGVTGIDTAAELGLLGDVIDGKTAADVATPAALQALADAAQAVMTGAAGGTAPTLAQLQALGLTGVTAGNLAAVQTAIAGTADDGTGVDTLAELDALIDTAAPVFSSGATASLAENTPVTTEAYNATADGDTGVTYTLGGADAARFDIDTATGAVTFKTAPDYEAPADTGGDNTYDIAVTATDTAGNATTQNVAIAVTNAADTSADLFALYTAAGSGTAPNTLDAADTAYAAAMDAALASHDTTSADGTANGSNAMAQYIDQVTGTDIVSEAEYDAGFTITGKATAGQAGTIKFYLDNNRTDGANEVGTQLQNGVNGVTIAYDNATGDYTLSFAAGSSALLQATHNTWGSGIHQLTVDTDGDGAKDSGEAHRLFLVASGTAQTTDSGLVTQNYSVQDKVTGDVFVYYHADPDGNGVGLWTQQDAGGDTATNTGAVTTNRDADGNGWGDWDYYNTTGVATGTETTAQNTALGYVTNLAAQTWEFHMGKNSASTATWSAANASATDHTAWNSNTSRLASEDELMALYAANFGADTGGGAGSANTVGAIQAITDTSSFNGYTTTEDNRPGGWAIGLWSSAPAPSGHAFIYLLNGDANDRPDAHYVYVSAVL